MPSHQKQVSRSPLKYCARNSGTSRPIIGPGQDNRVARGSNSFARREPEQIESLRSGAGLDQLQHLGTKPSQSAFTVQASEDGLGSLIQIAGGHRTGRSSVPEGQFGLESRSEVAASWSHSRDHLRGGAIGVAAECDGHGLCVKNRERLLSRSIVIRLSA